MSYIGSPAAPTIATVSDDTITTAKLADDAVTSAKITDGAVTPSDLSTGHPNWDSSGNVGIDKTPDSWASNYVGLQIGNSASIYGRSDTTNVIGVVSNSYYDGTSNKYIQNGNAERMYFNSGNIVFENAGSGTAGNSVTFTERMRIDSSGVLMHNTTAVSPATTNNFGTSLGHNGTVPQAGIVNTSANGGAGLYVNRGSDDGNLVLFWQNATLEGSITVSGTTVSYNGGHLSRWAQLVDGTKDESIVKGTVMTNLDKMAEWVKDGVEEDNEQLNCMAVSSVEGDPNVAGVFVNWDNDDDDFNDMNIAMTGDMVIRIAQGTTVERGNLLMSAGDGTAKPQEDDIVRSKTIAKVTSTHVSCTYPDGSYCVPCVLMAC